MKKLSSLLLLALFLFTGLSMKAQGWYAPGDRLDVSKITPGTDVFIYSMCYVNGNTGGSDYSRFIVNNGNNATTGVGKPSTLVTNNLAYIWRVRSVETVNRTENEVNYTGVQLTFSRNMGSDDPTLYWGIGGVTNNNNSPGDAQKFVFTLWKSQDPYVSGTSKSGDDVYLEDASGNIIQQSSIRDDDLVYLMCSLTGKAINTQNGNYGGTNFTNGYPVALYSVRAAEAPADPLGFHVSTASAADATAWADGTTWYKMVINSGGWRYLDTSASYCDGNGNLKMSNTAEANNLNSYWAITGNDTDGYKFYNAAAGPSKVLGVTGSDKDARMTMVAEGANGYTTSFDITLHTDGYLYIKKHGIVKDYINCRDGYVALWGLPEALGNSGSAFQIRAAELTTDVPTAFKTSILSRVEKWKKVPAIWPGATEKYNALDAVRVAEATLNTDLVSLANAANAASDAFVSAVDGVRFTASNRGSGDRNGAYMYLDGSDNTVKGRTTSTLTMDEVMTMKPNGYYFNFRIYNASLDKYIGTPGESTSGVALANAAGFDLFTSNGFNDNVVIFCISGTATMHLLNGLNVSNYSSTSDMASRWLLRTDVSRHELQTAINNATTFKTNLETLMNKLAAAKKISVKPTTLNVTLPPAITQAQNAFNNGAGTQDTRTAAAAALNATLTKAKGAWLGELGTTQQFRLKSHAITTSVTTGEGESVTTTTTNYYLTMAQTKNGDNEGNAILAAYDKDDANQIFTLVPGTGANAGKYILVSGSKQLTDLGFWNTDMTDAGTPYGFEDVDVVNSLFRVRTTKGLLGPNDGVTGADLTGNKKFLYTNHSGTRDNLTWELEFIAPTLGAVDKTSLQATLNAQNFVKNNSFDIVNQNDMPSVKTYIDIRENAEHVIDGQINGRTVTQIDVNTAEAELKAAYEQVLNNFISEADPTQGYRLIYYHPTNYAAKDLFLTFNTDAFQETNVVNALQLKRRSAATRQTAQFVSAGSDNSFYIMEGFNKKQVGESATYNWNPKLVDNGKVYTFEYVTLEGIDGIVVRLKNPQGYLGCDLGSSHAAVAENDYLYTNNSGNNYWIVQPCVSPDLVITLYGFEKLAEKYEGRVGTGVGQYTAHVAEVTDAELVGMNAAIRNYINDTSGDEKTNSGVQSYIDYYNNRIFPFTLNMPEVGKLYRFKGKKSKKYMASSSSRDKMVLNEANGIETVFKLVQDGGNYKLLNCGNGYFITNTHDASALKANANTITFNASESSSLGYYTIKTSYSSPYIYDDVNENEVDRNSSYAADYCDWTIEEVTYLPVPINTTVGFGTLYSPVDLKGDCGDYAQDERLEFYYGVKKENVGGNDKLVLTKLEGDIPAETGFIVKYKGGVDEATGCVFMKIADSAPKLTEETNQLKGTLETVAKPAPADGTVYTLQYLNNTLGLYKYTATNLKAGKAYYLLANGSAAPMGFVFDFEGQTTGVESIEVNADNQVIYDLSGRRVAKAGKGLYIINGKKVLVK